MVAITVVLAGVIGVMVFGLADDLGESQPTASLNFDTSNQTSVNISHSSGDSLEFDEGDYTLLVDGAEPTDVQFASDNISAGETVTVSWDDDEEYNETETVALRHEGSESIIHDEDVDFPDN